jgi:predicted metal-dependent hydrolase
MSIPALLPFPLHPRGGFFVARTQVQNEEPRSKADVARYLLHTWYQEKADFHFPCIAVPYLQRFARLGVEPSDFIIRKMHKRWGSCTATGKIILNTERSLGAPFYSVVLFA